MRNGPRIRLLATVTTIMSFGILAGSIGSVLAQQPSQTVIIIPPVIQLELGKQTSVPIRLEPPSVLGAGNFLRLRGLPSNAALSNSFVIAPDAWAVPLHRLQGLTLTIPGETPGHWDVTVSLVDRANTMLAEAKIIVVVIPALGTSGSQSNGSALKPIQPAITDAEQTTRLSAPPVSVSPVDRQRALSLYSSGEEQIKNGNIYAARKFFQRAAELGLAQAALSLGGTFDATELARLNVIGPKPDVDAARDWYEKARVLGATEADQRLSRLVGK